MQIKLCNMIYLDDHNKEYIKKKGKIKCSKQSEQGRRKNVSKRKAKQNKIKQLGLE